MTEALAGKTCTPCRGGNLHTSRYSVGLCLCFDISILLDAI